MSQRTLGGARSAAKAVALTESVEPHVRSNTSNPKRRKVGALCDVQVPNGQPRGRPAKGISVPEQPTHRACGALLRHNASSKYILLCEHGHASAVRTPLQTTYEELLVNARFEIYESCRRQIASPSHCRIHVAATVYGLFDALAERHNVTDSVRVVSSTPYREIRVRCHLF